MKKSSCTKMFLNIFFLDKITKFYADKGVGGGGVVVGGSGCNTGGGGRVRFTLSTWTKSSRWYYTIQIARTFFFNMFFFVRRQHVFVNYEKAIRFVSSVCLASKTLFFFFLCLSSVEQRRALMHAIFPRFSFFF